VGRRLTALARGPPRGDGMRRDELRIAVTLLVSAAFSAAAMVGGAGGMLIAAVVLAALAAAVLQPWRPR
jgi:hypothetical protein